MKVKTKAKAPKTPGELYQSYLQSALKDIELKEKEAAASKRKSRKKEVSSDEIIDRLQGNARAGTVILAPPPGDLEFKANLAWVSAEARFFVGHFLQMTIEDFNKDFLVIPFSAFRPVSKARILDQYSLFAVSSALSAALSGDTSIKRVITIGPHPFKHYVAAGKVSDPSAAYGHIVYPPARVDSAVRVGTPVFPIPPLTPFKYSDDEVEEMNYRERRVILAQRTTLSARLENMRASFERFMQLEPIKFTDYQRSLLQYSPVL